MTDYVIRRLLLMIPTFFGIALIVFVVLNLAPGRPGAQNQGEIANTEEQATQESFQIFREQFNLDKPTLFNTRFALTRAEVEHLVRVMAQVVEGSAQESLEDWGKHAVPHLIELLRASNDANEKKVRDFTVHFLRLTARRPLVDPFDPHPDPAVAAINQEINAENATIRRMKYATSAPEEEKQRVVTSWFRWYEKRRDRFSYSFGDKVRTFFLETRFAKYVANLAQFDFGVSLVSREPVVSTLVGKLKYSLSLSVLSLILAYLIAVPIGILSAVFRDTQSDRTATVILFMMYSLPSFFVATILLYGISEGSDWRSLRLFPTGGWQSQGSDELSVLQQFYDVLWHLVLPLFCMTYGSLAAISRYMRSGLLEVIGSDYVRTARAKGLSESSLANTP